MQDLRVIGHNVNRVDAIPKVTGMAEFVDDIKWPGMIYGKILRSPHAHALIISINYAEAEKLEGVYAVVTGKEIGDRLHGPGLWDEPVLAKDRVKFVGEGIAAVAAESVEAANQALKLIKVEYEPLPAVFDVEEAFRSNPTVIIHPELNQYKCPPPPLAPGFIKDRPNVYNSHSIESGDIKRGFQEADIIVEDKYTTARIQHCYLEPPVAIAKIEGTGNVNLWISTCNLHPTKNLFCNAFMLEPSRVRVYAPNVGGGFGGKQNITAAGVAYGLAKKAGRPVKVCFSREEVFVGAQNRDSNIIHIKDGFKKDGSITAREIILLQNGGAYAEMSYLTVKNACFGAVGTYKIPNFKISSYGVYTNEPVAGAFRGFGSTQIEWAVECQMDVVAEKLGISPVELRIKNLLNEGDINPAGEITHSIGIRECISKVSNAILQTDNKNNKIGPGRYRRGLGMAIGNKYSLAPTNSSVIVKIYEDGRVEARIGVDEFGQGLRTVIAQIVAEEFKISINDVQIISGDTGLCPYDEASVSSRSVYATGNAVRKACRDAKEQMFKRAAEYLETDPENLVTSEKKIYLKDNPQKTMHISDLFIKNLLSFGSYLPETGEFLGKATWSQGIELNASGINTGRRLTSFYTHGAQAVQILIDIDTGQVTIEKIWSAFDMGRAINPILCQGQIEGGAVMGIGSTLYEKMIMENGVTLNPSFTDYLLPTVLDVPTLDDNVNFLIEENHKDGPYGAKGLGEATMILTAPAIANAVYDAIGVRLKDLPLTPETISDALAKF